MAPLALSALTVVGCGDDEPAQKSKPPPGESSVFQPDGPTSGPRLWLEVSNDDGPVIAELWGAELGDTFGWAAHVVFQPEVFTTANAQLDEAVLGGAQAAHVVAPHAGDLTFGAARRGATLGPVPIEAPTLFGSFELVGTGSSRIDLRRVVVRRVDGSYVPVTTAGGQIDTDGETDGGAS